MRIQHQSILIRSFFWFKYALKRISAQMNRTKNAKFTLQRVQNREAMISHAIRGHRQINIPIAIRNKDAKKRRRKQQTEQKEKGKSADQVETLQVESGRDFD